MKKIKVLLVSVFLVVLMMVVSCSSEKSTSGPNVEEDTTPPTISFANIGNGQEVSGIFDVIVNASDNEEVLCVSIYFDDQQVGSCYSSPYSFSLNCNNYTDGEHNLQARVWDTSENFSVTDNITITTMYDFAPYSNGAIKVSISHFQELDPIDLTGYGDPYFIYSILIDDVEYERFTSDVFQNTTEINSLIEYCFDIPDNTREYCLDVIVADDDGVDYDLYDYTEASGQYYRWTLNPNSSDFYHIYNGEDDGSAGFDDNDCVITLQVETIQ